jgi:H2-forming N5,N10-methylenetetrahydromethanopterin dehydrogenase-like enzyme
MEEFNLNIKLKAKNQVEANQVKKAFETMVSSFKAEGIIKMEKIFKSDAFVRNVVKMKLGIK